MVNHRKHVFPELIYRPSLSSPIIVLIEFVASFLLLNEDILKNGVSDGCQHVETIWDKIEELLRQWIRNNQDLSQNPPADGIYHNQGMWTVEIPFVNQEFFDDVTTSIGKLNSNICVKPLKIAMCSEVPTCSSNEYCAHCTSVRCIDTKNVIYKVLCSCAALWRHIKLNTKTILFNSKKCR
uniref:Phlebovirus_G2 domain-containing protein n=1 Tax=Panagrellus redivivus TaxID=6233 RepID=A0A7E4ZVV5_PANRE